MQRKNLWLITGILILVLLAFFVVYCFYHGNTRGGSDALEKDDIVILYTNDVHCEVVDHIGYAGVAAFKKKCLVQTPYVTLVDCGDAVEGELFPEISRQEDLVDGMNLLMNQVGYDFRVLGNHEFDIGMDNVQRLIKGSKAAYLGCNIFYNGVGENKLSGVRPYGMIAYGDTKVAFIGVTTPKTVTKKRIPYLEENGERVYYFSGRDEEELYDCVQKTVQECQIKGADYVILLSHLGDDHKSEPFTSVKLIQNTYGIDVVLDAHSHRTIASRPIKNSEGKKVLLSSTGDRLENLGQLVISRDGNLTTHLISAYEYKEKDKEMEEWILLLSKMVLKPSYSSYTNINMDKQGRKGNENTKNFVDCGVNSHINYCIDKAG